MMSSQSCPDNTRHTDNHHQQHHQTTFKERSEEIYHRQNDFEAILPTLDNVKTSLPRLAEVKSCAMVGCGYATMELLVIQKCMPNVKQLIAVEPEEESLTELKSRLLQFPQFQAEYYKDTMQSWQGADNPVDAVLFFNCLCQIEQSCHQSVFQTLFDKVVARGGFIVILTCACCGEYAQSFFCKVYTALQNFSHKHVREKNVRQAMENVGFQFRFRGHYRSELNVEDRNDTFLATLNHKHGSDPGIDEGDKKVVTLDDVRKLVDEILGDEKVAFFDSLVLVFQKP